MYYCKFTSNCLVPYNLIKIIVDYVTEVLHLSHLCLHKTDVL